MSPKYQFNKEDFIRMIKVLSWSLAATLVSVLITFVQEVDVPANYVLLVPFVNAILYGINRYISDNRI
jgi:hypothetical protein